MKIRFCELLRAKIRSVYGQEKVFAIRLGVSESRVSQILSSPISYKLLQRILICFEGSDIDQLEGAWHEQFAKPKDEDRPSSLWSDERILSFAARRREFETGGTPELAVAHYQRIWSELEREGKRPRVQIEVGLALAQISYCIDRAAIGLPVVQEVVSLGRRSGEPGAVAQALWLQGVGWGTFGARASTVADERLSSLAQYLGQWVPRDSNEKRRRSSLLESHARDSVITAWRVAHRAAPGIAEVLNSRVGLLRQTEHAHEGLAKEVEARALCELGQIDGAHEALSVAEQSHLGDDLRQLKCQITRVRICLSEGDLSLAETLIGRAIQTSDRLHFVHYRLSLSQLERDLFVAKQKGGHMARR